MSKNIITFASSRKQNGDNYISLMYWVLPRVLLSVVKINSWNALCGCPFGVPFHKEGKKRPTHANAVHFSIHVYPSWEW